MSDEIDELKRQYRSITAPPHLAARIRANLKKPPSRRPMWIPIGASLTVAFGALTVTMIMQQNPTNTTVQTKPSLPSLSRMIPKKPQLPAPSVTQIRSVRLPALPPKPALKEPQSNFNLEEETPKERDNEYV